MIPLPAFLPGRERYIVCDVAPDSTSAHLLSIDAGKRLRLHRTWVLEPDRVLPSESLRPFEIPVIASLDSRIGETVLVPTAWTMKKGEVCTERDFYGTILGGLEAVLGSLRDRAGRALGTDELETVLIDARVDRFAVDGTPVPTPIGLEGRKIEGVLHATFAKREVFDGLRALIHGGTELFFTEEGKAKSAMLQNAYGGAVSLISLGHDRSYHFSADDYPGASFSKKEFEWTLAEPVAVLAAKFHLSPEVAAEIYKRWHEGEYSPHASEVFRKTFRPFAARFLSLLRKAKTRGKIFWESPLPIPSLVPRSSRAEKKPAGGMAPLSLGEISKISGVKLEGKGWAEAGDASPRVLAPFMEYYYNKGDARANRMLRRRIHWMSAT